MLRLWLTALFLLLLLGGCGNRSTPTPTSAPTPTVPIATPTPAPADLVETANRTGELTTFIAAVQAADLVEKLQSPGPFTLFAPTDAAFANLPAGLLDTLLNDPSGDLTDLLTYHMVAERLTSSQLSDDQQLTSILDDPLTVSKEGDGLRINDSLVLTGDISATNGVLYVIDAVLLPPGMGE
jgi:uncharacterized surface protein with fasciclin (FAS1) repeats